MLKKIFTPILFTIGTLLVSGCSSLPSLPSFKAQSKPAHEMYLRGVFSWWEADEQYKLKEGLDGLYSVSFELVADGQPYDFKLADAQWRAGYHCGHNAKFGSQQIQLNTSVTLDCVSQDPGNLQFTPSQTGDYRFDVDFSDMQHPVLHIRFLG